LKRNEKAKIVWAENSLIKSSNNPFSFSPEINSGQALMKKKQKIKKRSSAHAHAGKPPLPFLACAPKKFRVC
jgi:hypothetical protein